MDKTPTPPFNYEVVETNKTEEVTTRIYDSTKKKVYVEQTGNTFTFSIGKKDYCGRFVPITQGSNGKTYLKGEKEIVLESVNPAAKAYAKKKEYLGTKVSLDSTETAAENAHAFNFLAGSLKDDTDKKYTSYDKKGKKKES